MKTSDFVSITTWTAILIIAFGIMTKRIESNPTSWFFFIFFVISKITSFLQSISEKRMKEKP